MEVVVLAGGIGRRFGGSKQFTPVAPDGATLLEVTLHNARRAGCSRAVIVTAPGQETEVEALFGARPVDGLEVVVALQRIDDLPRAVAVDREKPWGTAHAVWAARDAVTDDFLLFNADDHYGARAPATLVAAMADHDAALLGFPLGTTLAPGATVSRALCECDEAGRLRTLREYPVIDDAGRDGAGRMLPLDALVSMNGWAFTPAVFPLIEQFLNRFLDTADLAKDECYLPAAIDAAIAAGRLEVGVVAAPDRWCGMTWPEDRDRVVRELARQAALRRVVDGFALDGAPATFTPFGQGLIHATWRVDTATGAYLLQRLNGGVFPDPGAMAENAAAAAVRVDDALSQAGDDDPRHRLVFLPAATGRPWLHDEAGDCWRLARFIGHARPPDASCAGEVRGAARALGRFPGLVADGAGPPLREILPGFHDTAARVASLQATVAADAHARLAACREEVGRLLELGSIAGRQRSGEMPTRFVHNDAKLDNVLVDRDSGEALCVIDLDTVMPGLAAWDFGDLVRSAVTGRPEDEPDLDRIVLREAMFIDLATGYLAGAEDWLTDSEKEQLVDGAIVITYEQALRFLADHLAGDHYYSVDDEGHNLRRARAQLRLLELLLDGAEDLRRCVDGGS